MVQFVLLVPQPLYYVTVEMIKICGEFSDVYYPNKGSFFAQLLLITVLYAPVMILAWQNRSMVNTCIRQVHPFYDFESNQLYVKNSPKNYETRSGAPQIIPTMNAESEDEEGNKLINKKR